jgi:outer membrane beta-barrel protein
MKAAWATLLFCCGAAQAQEETAAPPAEAPPATGGGMDFGAEELSGEAAAATSEDGTRDTALDEGISLTLEDRIKAVSRKVFLKQGRFELAPTLGITTNDPFFRTWSVGGRANWHLNDAFALELGGAYVPPFFIEKLPALEALREQASLINADAKLVGWVDGGVTFSPVYGKVAILSDAIIHFDTFVAAGGGAMFDTNADFVHPTMDIGAGLRVFLLRWLVVRVDLRDYVFPQDRNNISTLQNLLVLNLGVGFFLPPDFEYQYEAAKVRR